MPSSISFFNLLRLNIFASDEDPLDPISTHRNLYSTSTKASSTREKALVAVIFTHRVWGGGGIPSASELLNLFPVFMSTRSVQIHFLEFSKDGPADNRDKFTYGGLANQPVIL